MTVVEVGDEAAAAEAAAARRRGRRRRRSIGVVGATRGAFRGLDFDGLGVCTVRRLHPEARRGDAGAGRGAEGEATMPPSQRQLAVDECIFFSERSVQCRCVLLLLFFLFFELTLES